ncbi:uncharacterized protein FIBRA_04543 [Fibroporia radiculosa]|uniref:Protein kinase domain-containing protein n=1 Tax=Fibroporia radiculosa TaxID=599839 RepID=J4H307_9APHY|nr:uncharacterized protein FIBRA_04543 [Fibroporia radiculosa]CCM02444.1 predicted protein [Fibroporia radiculosa]
MATAIPNGQSSKSNPRASRIDDEDHGGDPKKNGRGESSSPQPSPVESSGDRVRGRSRTRTTPRTRSHDNLRRRGYHTLMSSFGKAFHVEKRWKLIREMGSGAYGYVISAADEISGEPVAIKMVSRAAEKISLAKRALREITLLRHFNHENITGLIDVDCTPDLNIFLWSQWKLICTKSSSQVRILPQSMSNTLFTRFFEVQYVSSHYARLTTQYARPIGMKYIHSASVVHRDLKPGNLLVNADCELKICDFGLSRGFESKLDENPTIMTEYVATRWYRAPEIMLAFRRVFYLSWASLMIDTRMSEGVTILLLTSDLYSKERTTVSLYYLSCALLSVFLLLTVDQLNKILEMLGTPDEEAQAYIKSLPHKKTVPFSDILPLVDHQAVDLLTKMLAFDPSSRITVAQALEHPFLSSYHDDTDEPDCPEKFKRWHTLEALETLEEYKEALLHEIEDYRREVRTVAVELPTSGRSSPTRDTERRLAEIREMAEHLQPPSESVFFPSPEISYQAPPEMRRTESFETRLGERQPDEQVLEVERVDPVVVYARRSSMFTLSRTNSTYSAHSTSQLRQQTLSPTELGVSNAQGGSSTVVFPTQDYVVPARSRTASMFSSDGTRKLLRTLSTVSIYESGEGLAGGLADIAPIGRYIVERDEALPSEMPQELDSPPQIRMKEKRKSQPLQAEAKNGAPE